MVDEREAAERPQQDAVRAAADAARRERVAELMDEDRREQHGAEHDEPAERPPLAGCCVACLGVLALL